MPLVAKGDGVCEEEEEGTAEEEAEVGLEVEEEDGERVERTPEFTNAGEPERFVTTACAWCLRDEDDSVGDPGRELGGDELELLWLRGLPGLLPLSLALSGGRSIFIEPRFAAAK